MKREICGVITKGTLTEGEILSANPEASYIMSVTENYHNSPGQKAERILGICLVDVATSTIILGQVLVLKAHFLFFFFFWYTFHCSSSAFSVAASEKALLDWSQQLSSL